jgi:hypothetical protein
MAASVQVSRTPASKNHPRAPTTGVREAPRHEIAGRHAATAVVLFADQSNLILEEDERPDFYRTDDRWLRLKEVDSIKVPEKDIKKWAGKPRRNLFEVV